MITPFWGEMPASCDYLFSYDTRVSVIPAPPRGNKPASYGSFFAMMHAVASRLGGSKTTFARLRKRVKSAGILVISRTLAKTQTETFSGFLLI